MRRTRRAAATERVLQNPKVAIKSPNPRQPAEVRYASPAHPARAGIALTARRAMKYPILCRAVRLPSASITGNLRNPARAYSSRVKSRLPCRPTRSLWPRAFARAWSRCRRGISWNTRRGSTERACCPRSQGPRRRGTGLDPGMGSLRWHLGPRHWHEDVRGLGAAQGATKEVRLRARPVGGGREGTTGERGIGANAAVPARSDL